MMDRRSFIGSLLGTMIVTRLPFIATAPNIIIPSVEERVALKQRALKSNEEYKCVIHNNKEDIYGTKLLQIEQKQGGRVFRFDGIEMFETLSVTGLSIINKDRKVVHTSPQIVFVTNGDSLHVTYVLSQEVERGQSRRI